MQKFTLLFSIILVTLNAKAQYFVTKVVPLGEVFNSQTDSKPITNGANLHNTSDVKWKPGQVVYVVSAKGPEKWTGNTREHDVANKSPNTNLKGMFVVVMHLGSESYSLMGRGAPVETIPAALQPPDSANGKVIIEKNNKYLFNPEQYPQSSGSAFFIQINLANGESVKRLLKAQGDTLLINYSDVATAQGTSPVAYQIGFYDRNSRDKTKLITSFVPYFDLTNETEGIVASSIKAFKNEKMPPELLKDKVYGVVCATSGKPNIFLFNEYFNKYLAK